MKNLCPTSSRRTADPFRTAMTLVLWCFLVMACSDGSRPRPPALEVESAFMADMTVREGSDPAVPDPLDEGREAGSDEAHVIPENTPVDIFAVMQSAGFTLESNRDLADYLPVPPRATGQVGRFSRGDELVSLARVTYPAEVFANPHEGWIRERMELIPESHERVVRQASTVVHIVGPNEAMADEVMNLFLDAMALPTRDTGVIQP